MNNDRRVFTIPNVLSLFRLLLLLPILICLIQEKRLEAGALMVLGALTDSMDGYIARRFHQASDLGRIIDPLIDKITVLGVVLLMVVHPAYQFPVWYMGFLLAREVLILAGGLLIIRKRKIVLESNQAGKYSAFINALAVLFFVLNLQPFAWIVLFAALIMTLVSTWGYWRAFVGASGLEESTHTNRENSK